MKRQIHVVDLDELVSESVYLKIMFANIWLMIDYIFGSFTGELLMFLCC